MHDHSRTPIPELPKPPATRWRFSLASILMAMTAISLALGMIRAIPMSAEMRQAFLGLSCVWGLVALVVLAPQWLRYASLQREVAARKAKTQRWLEEFRAAHTEPDSAPQGGSQGPTSEP